MDSILISIKKLLGIGESETPFDGDILIHINTAITRLRQLGVGPEDGFVVEDKYDLWDDFITDNLQSAKTYIYLKVKLMFDPPLNSSVLSAMQNEIRELEWTLNVEVDKGI